LPLDIFALDIRRQDRQSNREEGANQHKIYAEPEGGHRCAIPGSNQEYAKQQDRNPQYDDPLDWLHRTSVQQPLIPRQPAIEIRGSPREGSSGQAARLSPGIPQLSPGASQLESKDCLISPPRDYLTPAAPAGNPLASKTGGWMIIASAFSGMPPLAAPKTRDPGE